MRARVGGDAWVIRIVGDIEGAVAIAVIGAAGICAVLRHRQLTAIQMDLQAQAFAIPLDARVEDRNDGRGIPAIELPGAGPLRS